MPEIAQELKNSGEDLKRAIREAQLGQGLILDVQTKSDTITHGGVGLGAAFGGVKFEHNDYRGIGRGNPDTSESSYEKLVRDLPLECTPGYLESIERAPGTCEWILQEDKFKDWLQGDGPPVLWLLGGSGTGKTFLSAYIINYIKTRIENNNKKKSGETRPRPSNEARDGEQPQEKEPPPPQETLVFCFSDPGDSTRNTASGILGALLRQFLRDHWGLLHKAERRFADQLKVASSNTNALSGILSTILKDLGQVFGTIFIVIDGVDGCDSSSGKLFIRCLDKLLCQTKARLVVTSQPVGIVDELESTATATTAIKTYDIKPSMLKSRDIEKTIRHKFPKLHLHKYVSDEIKNKLQDHLIRESGDTFLWADLVIKDLEAAKGTLKGLEFNKILEKFRGTLQEAYGRILNDICRRRVEDRLTLDEVEFVLQFVAVAKRQLTAAEIDMAYAIWKAGDKTLGTARNDLPDATKVQRGIYESCVPLVSLNSETNLVELMHKSVAEYLLSSRSYFWLRMIRYAGVVLPLVSAMLSRYFVVIYLQIIPILFILSALPQRSLPASSGEVKSSPKVTRHYEHNLTMANALVLDICLRSLRGQKIDGEENEGSGRQSKSSSKDSSQSEENCFVAYVRKYWQDHALATNPERAISRLLKLCDQQNIEPLRDSLLLRAAKNGRLEVLRVLLRDMAASVTAQDINGKSPLHLSAFGGHLEVVRLLIKYGADLNKRDRIGATAIHWAAAGAQFETLAWLFTTYHEEQQRQRQRRRSRDVGHRLKWMGRSYSTPSATELPDFEMPDDQGGTLLAWAVEGGSAKVVQYLVENGAKTDVRYFRDIRRFHGHRIVSSEEFEEILQLLSDMIEPNRRQRTPLSRAAEQGYQSIAELLLAHGADPNFADAAKRTPIFWAAKRGQEAVIRLLKAKGANCHSQLLRAVIGRDPLAVKNLIRIGDADPNLPDDRGVPPLCWAAVAGDKSVVEALLQSPRADVNVRGKSMRVTPLILAAAYGEDAVAECLLAKGADVNLPHALGGTPLKVAADEGSTAVLERLLGHKKTNSSLSDCSGETALMVMASRGDGIGFKLLLERDKNLNRPDSFGRSVIFHAIRGGNRQIIDMLLSDPSVNTLIPDFYGATPLSMAARFGDNSTIRKLLQRGNGSTKLHPLVARDKFKRTPAMWAALKGHSSTKRLLLDQCRTMGLSSRDDEHTPVIIPTGLARVTRGSQPTRRAFCDICFFNIGDLEPYYSCKKCIGGTYVCCCECWATLKPQPYCLRKDHQLSLKDKENVNDVETYM